ncbi:MAG: alpha-2-macroglobulin domain protein [Phycisphaerales bacterium]|nr:alpha-2-macroglobulin domain protein [Phycisphaerales bacterium]
MHVIPAKASAGSRRFWVTVLCFAIANAGVWVGYDRWQTAHRHHLLEVTQFTPGDGATVEGRPTLVWSFNLDVAPAGKDAPAPGQISPAVAGRWEWPDARTLKFTPDAPLPRATPITVTLAPEALHTPDGFRLLRAYVTSLRTPALDVLGVRQAAFDERDRVVIELSFSDKVNPADVHHHLLLRGADGKAIGFQPHGSAGGNKVRVITDPVTHLLAGDAPRALDATLTKGLAGEAGPLGLSADRSWRIVVAADIVATEADASFPSHDDPSIHVQFNNDVDLEAIKQVLSVEPAVPFTLAHGYDGVTLRGPFLSGTRYTVKLARPPAGMAARNLPRPTSLSVLIPDRSPGIWFESEAGYLGTEGNRAVLAHAVNLTDLKVTVTRVYDNNLVAWRNGANFDRWRGISSYARPIATRDIRVPTKKNEKQDVRLSLDELLPVGESRDGVYQITLSAAPPGEGRHRRADVDGDEEEAEGYRYGGWYTSTVVTFSDIGLSAKQGRDAVTVWATSLQTAKPIEGVHVRLYSNKNQLLGTATTGHDGLAKVIPTATPAGEKPGVVIAEQSAAANVHEGGDDVPGAVPQASKAAAHLAAERGAPTGLTWLDLRSSEVSFGDSDTSGRPYLRKGYEAFVYTERGIYRPGEVVHLRAILRGADGATPPRFPVRWQIRRPDLRDWKAQLAEVDADGASSFDLQLPSDLPMGRWTAHIGLPGENGSAGKFFGSVAFDVEDFLPQRMKVAVEIEGAGGKAQGRELPRIALTDEPISADVQADYLFGRPVAERPATLIVRADPAPFQPAQYREWVFGDSANTAEALGHAKQLGRRAELPEEDLDATGHATWDVDVAALIEKGTIDGDGSESNKPVRAHRRRVKKSVPVNVVAASPAAGKAQEYRGPWRLTVTGSVTEAGGRAVTATRAVDVDRVPYYVGLHPRETAPRPGVPAEFDVQLVTPAGAPATTDGWLEATFFRESWNSSYVYENNSYRFHSTRLLEPVQKEPQSVAIERGRGVVSVTPPAGGSYVLLVRDPKTQCVTTIAFYAEYGAWEDNISRQNPEKLDIVVQPLADPETDKWMTAIDELDIAGLFELAGNAAAVPPADGKIRIGRPAQVIVRSPFPGQLLLSVETDGVLSTRVLEMPANHIAVPIEVPEACRPNAYVTATVIRAIDPSAKWQTHRAIGTVRMPVDNTDRKLTVELAVPKEIRPATSLAVPLRVLDSEGNPVANAAVTVAAVDEGICQVTNFLTPDPFGFFTGKRALGVHTADAYGQLMPEVAKADKESAVGGDDDAAAGARHTSPIKSKRVKPVALVSGVLHTDAQGLAQADFSVPEFAGQLRVMAVASAQKAFGSSDQGVFVRSPLLVQSSWPRFAAPGDRFAVPLVVFNNSADAGGDVAVSVKFTDTDGPLKFAANKDTKLAIPAITVKAGGQGTATFEVIAQDASGIAHARLIATMAGETYEETVEIPVRPASPVMSDGGYLPAKPGAPTFIEIPGGMLDGTVRYELRVSSSPQLQLPEGLDYLDHYPYGCVEQTTSTLFPLVYLSDVGEKISPGMFDKDRVADKIRVGVLRLMSMQTADGGLAMWPGGHEDWDWGTVYATHFLVEAGIAGHEVPEEFRNQLLTYLHTLLAKPQADAGTVELQTYAAYVLALAGKPDRPVMSRLSELLATDIGSGQARFHLAAAWLAAGRRDLAAGLLPQALPAPRAGRELGGNVGSPIRDQALIASTLLAVDPTDLRIPDLIQKLADAGRAKQWRSTQDTAFALMAIGRYLRQTKGDAPYETAEVLLDGKQIAAAEDGQPLIWSAASLDPQGRAEMAPHSAALPAPGTKLEIRITGPAAAKGYVSWLRTGVPVKPVASADNGLKVRRRYLDEHGKPLEALRVHSGDLVQVELTLEGSGETDNIVVEDLLPAGLEIENPRLEGNAADLVTRNKRPHASGNGQEEEPHFAAGRADMHDDRLVVMGRLTDGRAGTYVYTARAVAPGVFVVPPVKAECMYDSAANSLWGGGTFTVLAADSAKIADTGKE